MNRLDTIKHAVKRVQQQKQVLTKKEIDAILKNEYCSFYIQSEITKSLNFN